MNIFKKLCSIVLCFALLSSCIFSLPVSAQTTTKRGFISGKNVRVRTEATTKSDVVDMLSYVPVTVNSMTTGQEVSSGNNIWYHITYNDISGYVYSKYVNPIMDIYYDDDFEANLSNFPESYHPYLRALHEKYPNWKFIAHNLPLSFKDAVESQYGVSSVDDTIKWVEFNYGGNEWRDKRAYDESTNSWETLESRWTYASRAAIEYFMDPRNSLNENNVFVFMQQSYDANTQTKDALRTITAGTFLSNGYDKNFDGIVDTDAYLDDIMNAAAQSGVSPFVLAATILVEQGRDGMTNMVSGTYPGFVGYYNFFNYNAGGSTTAEISASALSYAVEQGWNSREAAIVGGAKKYSNGYISVGQDTYYYKDFNVINQRWSHQYATAVYDAWTNASYLQKGCVLNTTASLVFEVPVYTDMPASACYKPFSDGWQIVDGYWYYYSYGNTFGGWIQHNGYWYYLNPDNHNRMAVHWANISGTWYYFNDQGIMLTGWQLIEDTWYCFGDSGGLLTGWQLIGGRWYYFGDNGALLTGWRIIDGAWYHFDLNGVMLTGWHTIGDAWYFFGDSGAMLTGWQFIGESWYYFGDNGAMLTGWQLIGGTWYYFGDNGAMYTGWHIISGAWYYLNTNGAMLTGWQLIEGTWYYFSGSGVMLTGWLNLGDSWYYMNVNGAMHTGWLWDNAWYFLQDNGAMAVNIYIDGGYINSSGIWSL